LPKRTLPTATIGLGGSVFITVIRMGPGRIQPKID
jgi:hypothetical protein